MRYRLRIKPVQINVLLRKRTHFEVLYWLGEVDTTVTDVDLEVRGESMLPSPPPAIEVCTAPLA